MRVPRFVFYKWLCDDGTYDVVERCRCCGQTQVVYGNLSPDKATEAVDRLTKDEEAS